MVINQKYVWQPEDRPSKRGQKKGSLGSAVQLGFKQILEYSSHSVNRRAKEVTAKIPGLERARELMKTAISSATIAIPRQLELLRGWSRLLPSGVRPARPITTPSREPNYEPFFLEPSASEIVETAPFSDDQRAKHSSVPSDPPEVEMASGDAGEPLRESTPGSEIEPISLETRDRMARTDRFTLTPARSRFMARVLASQGHRDLALSIYEELIEHNPEERDLREEAAEVRNGQLVCDQFVRLSDHLPADSGVGLFDDEKQITLLDSSEGELRLSWTVTPEGRLRAESVLGQPGELVIRVFEVLTDSDAIVRTRVIEHGPVPNNGSWTATELEVESRRSVAVGVRAEQRFASIAHIPFAEM
ncbi:MAG: tetratricopeptide repeat protein [Deltaproteobacteria bacterium]|nr:tetratricopeptide repeat protein [Deltaproteobacteria bacterium]